ncbi:MAG: gliding motility-associated C-terminal domain-containing protein [Chitinophagaceae bacterium]|nr:gliding motility-associated C-terminal domain-containing protein [Chitinophagaceae bacterium]
MLITTIPYPQTFAGADTIICYNTPALLNGSHNGNRFSWSPTTSLLNSHTLTPTAYPARTQEYVLSSWDDRGCPKPGYDTVLVTVLPDIIPYAGRDTMVVVGQPLQLNAEGGVRYEWIPATALSDPHIKNPVAVYGSATDSIRYTVRVYNEADCYDSASVKVTVFKTTPTVFVPTAFTPNGDGLNDVLRPIAVGVERINYFSIYNRWGQLVFTTTTNGAGWDGRISGDLQGTNVFVWMVSAVDYLGNNIFLKGTTTLIR